jgi:hypothetical protein
MVFMIPITAIVMSFGTAIIAIYFSYRKRKEMFAMYHQQRMAAIEKGIELPPMPEDFFREDGGVPKHRGTHGTLLAGLILIFTGLILFPALHYTLKHNDQDGSPALFALIPVGVGMACLIYYLAVGRRLALALEEERKVRLAEAAKSRNPQA